MRCGSGRLTAQLAGLEYFPPTPSKKGLEARDEMLPFQSLLDTEERW